MQALRVITGDQLMIADDKPLSTSQQLFTIVITIYSHKPHLNPKPLVGSTGNAPWILSSEDKR